MGRKAALRAPQGRATAHELDDQRQAFCEGLHPILLRGDLEAFRAYLAQWEDVIGDSSELAEASPQALQRTMADLLRYPRRFNLPPWPARPPAEVPRPTAEVLRQTVWHEPAEASDPLPDRVPDPLGPPPATSLTPQVPTPPGEAVPAPARPGAYQLDMLSGELVPVEPTTIAERPAGEYDPLSGASPRAGADAWPETGRKSVAKRKRRRTSANLVQLTFWPHERG
ncbi:MAG TPA: hypothetical protein VHS99_03945 [Chloroflexota bacterium]|nr:hypothetical protein [Chloroflexota bacterium]